MIIGTVHVWRIDSIHHLEVGIAANNTIINPEIVFAIGDHGAFNNAIPLDLATDSLIYTAAFPPLKKGLHIYYYIEAIDGADTITRLPRNAPDSVFSFYVGDTIVTPPSGVKANTTSPELTLSPNPAHDIINIRAQTDEAVSYKITDALGHEILVYDAGPNIDEIRIRLNRFASGTYYVQARSVSGKFIKNGKFIVVP